MRLTKAEVQFVEAVSSERAIKRKARTMSLNEEQFERFQVECETRGLAANKVIDALIGLFLESPKD